MAIKHIELEIDKDSPFKNCKLNREKYAEVLTSIVENYSEGFVMAINNKWGTGKTTFVKMWQQSLKNKEYKTIYFNAWENDFEDNPLTALIGEIKEVFKDNNDEFKKVLKSAAKLSKNIAPALVKAVLNKYIDSETFLAAINDTIKTASEIFEEDVIDYAKRKNSIKDFRKNLENFIAKDLSGKPLIFIIDELDRCRPNYSVLLLEQIKHFFNIPNIIFILSIDKNQLGHAICGVYGSDKIDSSEYLRRFIDIEYSIPIPESGSYFNYLYDYFKFDTFLNSPHRKKHSEFQSDDVIFISTSKILLNNCNLRQIEKILSSTRITLRTLNYNNYLVPSFFTFLIYIKFMHSEFYSDILIRKFSLTDAQINLYEILKEFNNEENERYLIELEGLFLVFYQNYLKGSRMGEDLYELDKSSDKYILKQMSKINNEMLLDYYVSSIRNNRRIFDLKLDYFTDRIELTESLKIL